MALDGEQRMQEVMESPSETRNEAGLEHAAAVIEEIQPIKSDAPERAKQIRAQVSKAPDVSSFYLTWNNKMVRSDSLRGGNTDDQDPWLTTARPYLATGPVRGSLCFGRSGASVNKGS